ncbi:hypothetical protein NE619_01440 [Anaerovorax odorimutans]|uniref:Tetrahydromethanopterin S-methyltransferase n=1 Tax=Anaerovorax odorimutans TaxID=109327 RepID=A0ABT1RJM2_9FIRM|nr:hypothetical protein [Anaerovorax odorimutans]MCQ4635379.1 hypothetical protein [Anaerovorax odorimutans]
MLPVEQLPIDIKGITPEMRQELEERISDFEREHEPETSRGGEGYVPKIRKVDYIFAGVINGLILLYYIVAVLLA